MPRRSPALLAPLLASQAPVTFAQLQAALGQASRATTFRYLAQIRHWRSYNHNGRFYTDRHPDRFDEFGLLSLGDVHFSRHGSLAATVRHLLDSAEQGWTAKQLQALLRVPVQPFLLAASASTASLSTSLPTPASASSSGARGWRSGPPVGPAR